MSEWAEGNGHRDLPRSGTGRRRSLITLLVLLVALPLTFVISSLLGPGWRPVISVERLERQSVIYLPAIRVFVVSTEDGLVALSAMIEGDGRALFCRRSGLFQAPGGVMFARTGSLVAGPVPRDMNRVGIRVEEGFVEVNPEVVTRGSLRPKGEILRPLEPGCRVPDSEDPPGFATEAA
jgi:hypothetical protein